MSPRAIAARSKESHQQLLGDSPATARQKKQALYMKKSREVRSQLEAQIAPPSTGSFKIKIPSGDNLNLLNEKGRESIKFMKRLKNATKGDKDKTTTSNVCAKKTLKLGDDCKTDMMLKLPDIFEEGVHYDVKLTLHASELKKALHGNIEIIKVPATSKLISLTGWTIDLQIRSMYDWKGPANLPCYPPLVGETTPEYNQVDLTRAFGVYSKLEKHYKFATFPNIASRCEKRLTPNLINSIDLVRKINNDQSGTRSPREPEWMILSKVSSSSLFHVDAAGFNTAVVVVEGSTKWYTANGGLESVARTFRYRGAENVHYESGVSTINLGQGDCLIQGPGTVNASITTKDCLLAGRFFYTAETFARTILTIVVFKQELRDSDFENLTLIVKNLNGKYFNDGQRGAVSNSMSEMLVAYGAIDGELSEAGQEFLKVGYSWLRSYERKKNQEVDENDEDETDATDTDDEIELGDPMEITDDSEIHEE